MPRQRWFLYIQAVVVIGALLALAACSVPTTQTGGVAATATTAPTATATAAPTATATLTPPTCGSNFTGTTYYTTLPDSTYQKTNVYAQVQLPPLTRSFDNDAPGGVRGRNMCSAGSTASVLAFMQSHLTGLGWQQVDTGADTCISVDTFGQQQCWKNGSYALTLAINTNADWIIVYRDPDFS